MVHITLHRQLLTIIMKINEHIYAVKTSIFNHKE